MPTLINRLADTRPAPPLALMPGQARGRGARSNVSGRFEPTTRLIFDDGWETLGESPESRATSVTTETVRSIITHNQSPDISFDRSINPYRGCEHGCTYCYARPSHSYMGLSAGLDFESKLFAKANAAEALRAELSAKNYTPRTIALGANTDAYQPIEKRLEITRSILKVLAEFNHPVGIITKSALVLRDLDILQPMAEKGLVKVAVSVTTLDPKLSRSMEPRAAAPHKRLQTLEVLSKAGIPTVAMLAPLIPALNDHEIEAILNAVSAAGVKEAGYVLLRLPLELDDIFREWLMTDHPGKAAHVLSLIRNMRAGKTYDSTFGTRMTGTGPYAWTLGRRFEMACRRLGINTQKVKLDATRFMRPPQPGEQLSLL
jgi:DNA repair photolyase